MSDETKADETATLGSLAAALAKAQGAMKSAAKDSINPHFQSRYADLASVWDACRGPLAANGLAVIQRCSSDASGVTVTTMLVHASGEWMRDRLTLPVAAKTPQAYGSAITYGRRYGLAAMVGIAADVDDDGAAATGTPPIKATGKPTGTAALKATLKARADTAEPPEQEEPPPPSEEYAPPDAAASEAVVGWGNKKGTPVSKLTARDLDYYAGKAQETLENPEKERFWPAEAQWLSVLQAEKRRRG